MKIKTMIPPLLAGLLLAGGVAVPAHADHDPAHDSARGTVKISETEVTDATPSNEVKVGCDFSLDFFGMAAGTVPIRFVLMPPSGEGLFAERTAVVQEAQGSDLSGTLDVDLTQDLSKIAPAVAQDFDYKLKVEAVVKTTSGGNEVTKSAVLFVICPAARAAAEAAAAQAAAEAAAEAAVAVRADVRKIDKCGRAGDMFFAKRVEGVRYLVKGETIRKGTWLKAMTRTVKVRAVAASVDYRVVGQDTWVLRFTNRSCATPPQVLPATGA
ncbi:hypothetical protein [Nocardioides sp.]|uniref:hypothetical protein n=1 Tax=Nocardioides sp. TaxID=35761 RepID=UPI002CC9C634|nr:hypothetical protein [Nocardioides sp.]HXH79753.1 hypothetical protein [Nocardioides sp.]